MQTVDTSRTRRSLIRGALVGALTLSAALVTFSVLRARIASAQEAPDAATVAAWVQAFYDQTQTINARFVQRYVNRVYQRTDTSRGRVRFKKPGMMRFDYDEPNGKIVASNGERLMVFEPGDDGGSGQYFEQAMADAQLPSALSFLTGVGRLDRDFTFRLLDAARLGYTGGQVLELRSRRPTAHYSRILLFVDDDPARRGVVHTVLIIDHSGNRNRFDFLDQQLNRPMPTSVFNFRPPAGARRIQP